MTNDKQELKPCPFCKALGWMQIDGGIFQGEVGYRVECQGKCHAMTCYWHTEEQAIQAWNTRATPDAVEEISLGEFVHSMSGKPYPRTISWSSIYQLLRDNKFKIIAAEDGKGE